MWLSPDQVGITLVTHWDRPLGNRNPPVANQRSIRRLVVQACHNQVFGSQVITGQPKTASNWGFMSCVSVSRFCKRQFFSFKSRYFTVRLCQIRKNTSSDEFKRSLKNYPQVHQEWCRIACIYNHIYNIVFTCITSSHGNLFGYAC